MPSLHNFAAEPFRWGRGDGRGFARKGEGSVTALGEGAVGLLPSAMRVPYPLASNANRAAKPYSDLLHDEVTGPLGMTETAIKLNRSLQSRFTRGTTSTTNPTHAGDLDALAGAGAIRSTAAEMLTYLEAQLHPRPHYSGGPRLSER